MHAHSHLSTFLFQVVNFLVLVLVLRRWLYRPVLAMIERRQQETQAPLAAAATDRKAAADLRADAERLQADARAARENALAGAAKESQVRREALLDEARRAADELAARRRDELAQERAGVEAQLRARAAEVAVAIAERLLASAGCASATQRLLDEAVEAVEAMDPRQRAAPADSAGLRVEVLTAMPLEPSSRNDVTDRLRRALGDDVSVGFAEDPALIAGAEIHLPTAVVRQSWRDQLAEARRALS
jgi:F-type H+-transporting ATPase subunit b